MLTSEQHYRNSGSAYYECNFGNGADSKGGAVIKGVEAVVCSCRKGGQRWKSSTDPVT